MPSHVTSKPHSAVLLTNLSEELYSNLEKQLNWVLRTCIQIGDRSSLTKNKNDSQNITRRAKTRKVGIKIPK